MVSGKWILIFPWHSHKVKEKSKEQENRYDSSKVDNVIIRTLLL